jgi:hypothetical protein
MQELASPQSRISDALYDEIERSERGAGFLEFPYIGWMLSPPRKVEDTLNGPAPEDLIPNDYLISAKYLKEKVIREGVGILKYMIGNMFWHYLGYIFPKFRRRIYRFGVVAGHHELRFIMTIQRMRRANYFHLSVLPCRFGKLYDWEIPEIKQSFQMHEPIRMFEGHSLVHFYWGELK